MCRDAVSFVLHSNPVGKRGQDTNPSKCEDLTKVTQPGKWQGLLSPRRSFLPPCAALLQPARAVKASDVPKGCPQWSQVIASDFQKCQSRDCGEGRSLAGTPPTCPSHTGATGAEGLPGEPPGRLWAGGWGQSLSSAHSLPVAASQGPGVRAASWSWNVWLCRSRIPFHPPCDMNREPSEPRVEPEGPEVRLSEPGLCKELIKPAPTRLTRPSPG